MTRPVMRAPRDHGGLLAVPPLAESAAMLERNRQSFAAASSTINDLSERQTAARRDALQAARQWMLAHGLTPPTAPSDQLILTGHQPELFHPGVWIKNFAACGLGRKLGLTAVNLIIDNDLAKSASILVPRLWQDRASTVPVAMDDWGGPTPYEELRVGNERTFARFRHEVKKTLGPVEFQPLLSALWGDVVCADERPPRLGERLAFARHWTEVKWGCDNFELPVSALCETTAFIRFAQELLTGLPRFHQIHNDCLHAYRREHGIRGKNHPVADLARDGDWLEAPFWVWRDGDHQRVRPLARHTPSGLEMRCGREYFRLPLHGDLKDPFSELQIAGWKLRPRALTTTLFARVFLADLFIHGIGGATYDALTDAIIRDYYQMTPPEFITLSATMHLPFAERCQPRPQPEADERRLRDMYWNPDRHLPEALTDPALGALVESKQKLMRESLPNEPAVRRERFHLFRELNERLRPPLRSEQERTQQQLEADRRRLRKHEIALSREYAFVLYPEEELRSLFTTRLASEIR